MQAERILIVEDEPVVALDLRQTLEEMGHQVEGIHSSVPSVLAAIEREQPSMVLMDIHLGGARDGVDAAQEIYQRWGLPVIYLTAFADDRTIERAAATKPFGYLLKPFQNKELAAVIQVAHTRHQTECALAASEARLAIAVEAAELGIWEWESQLDKLQGDERFNRMLGGALCHFHTHLHAFLARVHPDDRATVEQGLNQPGFFSCAFRALRDNGEQATLEMHGQLRPLPGGHREVIGAIRDITERVQMEEQLRQASVVFSTTAEGIMILDEQYRIRSVNPALSRLTEYRESELLGQLPDSLLLGSEARPPSYAAIAASSEGYWSGEVCARRRHGELFPSLQHICAVRDASGKVLQYVHTLADISAMREAERQLAHLAYHDALTGLGNRYLLNDTLESEIARAQRNERIFAVIFLDLDGFKSINDTVGHHVGDRVIQEIARRLTLQIRRQDTAVRLGGDEFVVVCPDLHHAEESLVIAQKLLKAMDEPVQIDTLRYNISVSIGVALYPEDGNNLNALLSAADSAMYEAKRQGKGRYCGYLPTIAARIRERLEIEQGLHAALAENQFELHYQPVVDLKRRCLIGFEALVRWRHPERGMIAPDQFIGIAEESGFIEPLGRWILNTAIAQAAAWQQAGAKGLLMAVNVSARQFNDEQLVDGIVTMLARHGLAARQLEIEVTESTVQEFHRSKRIVDTLRERGIAVALDDFGTGYSSLSLLKHLPINRVKIDRSFVIALPGTARDAGLISAIMQMANSLDLEVTAEGIETPEQAAFLNAVGCPAVQGYLFSRPAPASQFTTEWLCHYRESDSFQVNPAA